MKIVSSKSTFIMKRVFPMFWFGSIAVIFVVSLLNGTAEKDFMFLVMPVLMVVFGFFLMKKLVWNLMDEVADYVEYLAVRFRGQEDTIYLTNISHVNVTSNQSPPRITLRLRTPCRFGEEVSFSPVSSFSINPFRKNEVAEDLIVRVNSDRNRGESNHFLQETR